MANDYDLAHYPAAPYEHTHPASLSVYAALAGLPYVPFETCRTLEIGCGDGTNLIAMALGAPRARFLGVDLAETPIRQARAAAAACGLDNVEFQARDLCGLDASDGEFDYIVAHGVLAWVPEPVRAALFRVIGERLAPGGFAMVSFNAFPGSRARQAIRDMLIYETRDAERPEQKVRLAVAFLERIAAQWSADQPDEATLIDEARRLLARDPAILFHDEMAENFAPQMFSDVAAAAKAHGLEYLAGARSRANSEALFPSETYAAAKAEAAGDIVRFEQQLDFLRLRRFHNSIFVKGRREDLQRDASRLKGLWALGDLRRGEPEAAAPDAAVFEFGPKARINTNDPSLTALLTQLADGFPQAAPLDAVSEAPGLADQVFQLFVNEIIHLRTTPDAVAREAGDRPQAGPLARLQAARGQNELVTRIHRVLRLEDPDAIALVPLMDGTRDRAQLAKDWGARTGVSEAEARAALESLLPQLTRAGLLLG